METAAPVLPPIAKDMTEGGSGRGASPVRDKSPIAPVITDNAPIELVDEEIVEEIPA